MTDTTPAVGEIIKTDVRGRMRVSTERRQSLLAEYEQSGLSAKKFAQLAGIKYQTFANWLQKRRRLGSSPTKPADSVRLLEAMMEQAQPSLALLVHLPGGARMEISHTNQAALAADLLQALAKAC